MYPLSPSRPVPTTDSATWWHTPTALSAWSRLLVARVKKSSTAWSSKDGELDTVDDDVGAGDCVVQSLTGEDVGAGRE